MSADRDRDLAAYYDQEAPSRAERELAVGRLTRRDEFVRLLADERRTKLLEVGVGPGRDAVAFHASGVAVTGVDLSSEHVRIARAAGVEAVQSSVLELPFPDHSFDAVWTMSTLLHVPNAEFDVAMSEIGRVARPGSPIAIGLWGGPDSEGPSDLDTIEPRRFFSIRSDERLQSMIRAYGAIERFETWTDPGTDALHYQWLVLRCS